MGRPRTAAHQRCTPARQSATVPVCPASHSPHHLIVGGAAKQLYAELLHCRFPPPPQEGLRRGDEQAAASGRTAVAGMAPGRPAVAYPYQAGPRTRRARSPGTAASPLACTGPAPWPSSCRLRRTGRLPAGPYTDGLPAFGYFDAGDLMAVVWLGTWHAMPTIGVLTHPHARGRGLARAVVTAATREGLKNRPLVQYRAWRVNSASLRVAEHTGFTHFCESLIIDVDQ